jgi:hypothetical protein
MSTHNLTFHSTPLVTLPKHLLRWGIAPLRLFYYIHPTATSSLLRQQVWTPLWFHHPGCSVVPDWPKVISGTHCAQKWPWISLEQQWPTLRDVKSTFVTSVYTKKHTLQIVFTHTDTDWRLYWKCSATYSKPSRYILWIYTHTAIIEHLTAVQVSRKN